MTRYEITTAVAKAAIECVYEDTTVKHSEVRSALMSLREVIDDALAAIDGMPEL